MHMFPMPTSTNQGWRAHIALLRKKQQTLSGVSRRALYIPSFSLLNEPLQARLRALDESIPNARQALFDTAAFFQARKL